MKNNIKRLGACALIAAMAVAAVGCAKTEPEVTEPIQETVAPEVEVPTVVAGNPDDFAAILIDTYGEAFLATQMMDAAMLEAMYEITPDMYDNSFAAMPMMMGHVDEVVMLHAEDVAPILEKLNARKEMLANDMFQYPANLPRLAAIDVVDFENGWVGLFILGGQADMALQEEWGEDTEKAVTYYIEQNKKGIDALKQYFVDGIVPEVDISAVMMPVMTEEIDIEITPDEGLVDEVTDVVEDVVDEVTEVVDETVENVEDIVEDVADEAVSEDVADDAADVSENG